MVFSTFTSSTARWRRWALLLTLLLLVACSTTTSLPEGALTAEPPEMAQESQAETEAEKAPPTDEDVIYHVLAAEYLGAEGELESAVEEYLEAALQSEDPAIAERATRVAFSAQAWQQAAMASDRWAVLAPDSVEAHESATVALLMLGDFAGAEFQVLEILEILDGSVEAWLLVSSLLAQAGSPERADEVLAHVLEVRGEGDRAAALFARSQLAARSRDIQQAFELVRQAIELEPERIQFLTWAGRLALNLQLPETALEYIRRAWELDPGQHDLALAYADLLAKTGNGAEARQVMQSMPQSPDVMLTRILFELSQNERAAAESLFRKFETGEYDEPMEQAFQLGRSAEALGWPDRAIDYYGKVTKGDRLLAAFIRRAELKAIGGDVAGAREDLAALRQQDDPLVVEEAWLAESRILREMGNREEGIAVLDQAINEVPESIPLLYSRALMAAELGRVDSAERDLRVVLAAQPDNPAALNALGYTLADQTDRLDEAEALIRQALTLQPNEPSIIDSMGWLAFRQGRNQEAIQFLQRAWNLDHNPEIAAHLGEVLWVEGQQDAATAIWRDGMAVDDGNPVLLETLERLGIEL